MRPYTITYTIDNGINFHIMIIEAIDYTKAYLEACFKLPMTAIITDVR